MTFEPLPEQTVIDRLVHWAGQDDAIRAMILYSSRANPEADQDLFSDYDILLFVTDIHPFHADDRWLEGFGRVLVVFKNPIEIQDGFESFGFITHYQDGTKIDYGFFPIEYLQWAAQQPRQPDDLDNGYRVLLDKDGLTGNLRPPTYTAYAPIVPDEKEYQEVISTFFNNAAYVAKDLWRDNLFNVKLCLDHFMKFTDLRKMMEWQTGIQSNWSVKPGAYGKGLKKRIDPAVWAELESTYVGAGAQENWEALFKTIELFRKVAVQVGSSLGYAYPHVQDRLMLAYLRRVRELTGERETK